jgi:hypothetical protein
MGLRHLIPEGSGIIFGQVCPIQAVKTPVWPGYHCMWHSMTVSLYLGQDVMARFVHEKDSLPGAAMLAHRGPAATLRTALKNEAEGLSNT